MIFPFIEQQLLYIELGYARSRVATTNRSAERAIGIERHSMACAGSPMGKNRLRRGFQSRAGKVGWYPQFTVCCAGTVEPLLGSNQFLIRLPGAPSERAKAARVLREGSDMVSAALQTALECTESIFSKRLTAGCAQRFPRAQDSETLRIVAGILRIQRGVILRRPANSTPLRPLRKTPSPILGSHSHSSTGRTRAQQPIEETASW